MPTIIALLRFTIRVLIGRLLGWEPQPLRIRLHGARKGAHAYLTPRGRLLAGVAGGDGSDDDDDEGDDEQDDDDEDEDKEPDPSDWDRERAAATIRNQRKERRKLEKERKAAERRAEQAEARQRELEQAQESEHDATKRQLTEAQTEAQALRAEADRLRVDSAIRDAALEAGVDPKRVKRMLRLVDRNEITVENGEVDTDVVGEAVGDVLDEFPEFKAATTPPPAPPNDDENENENGDDEEEVDDVPKTGNPDRKRRPKPMTTERALKLLEKDPDKFHELYEAGQIPRDALANASK